MKKIFKIKVLKVEIGAKPLVRSYMYFTDTRFEISWTGSRTIVEEGFGFNKNVGLYKHNLKILLNLPSLDFMKLGNNKPIRWLYINSVTVINRLPKL